MSPERFPNTSWTLLATASGGGGLAGAALEELSNRYYLPVHAFLKALVGDTDDLADFTQDFFQSKFLSQQVFRHANRSQGRFRHYLEQALRNYVRDSYRKTNRIHRILVPLDDAAINSASIDPWSRVDGAFHVGWVRALLDRAIMTVRADCEANQQVVHYNLFLSRYLAEPGKAPSWRNLGLEYALDERTARHRAETVLRQFRQVVMSILTEETGSEAAAKEELAMLIALLGEDYE